MKELQAGESLKKGQLVHISESDLVFKNPVYKSRMIFLNNNLFAIEYAKKMPNWWWRLWQYLLLGIKWESLGN